MIYIISGASRSGKSLIGTKLLKQKSITLIEVDNLMMAFHRGMPETRIHPENWPDVTAKMMEPFLNGMIYTMIENKKDAIIEGEQFLPENLRVLMNRYPKDIKACFLGFTDIDLDDKVENSKKFADETDWLISNSDEYIRNHINNMKEYSKKIKAECEKHNVRYFDSSSNFIDTLDEVIAYLTK